MNVCTVYKNPVVRHIADADHGGMSRPKVDKNKAPTLEAFGPEVRRQRRAMNYSQEGFADHCGLDRTYVGSIERGEYNPTLANIYKIVDALGLPAAEFFKGVDQRRQELTAAGKAAAEAHTDPTV